MTKEDKPKCSPEPAGDFSKGFTIAEFEKIIDTHTILLNGQVVLKSEAEKQSGKPKIYTIKEILDLSTQPCQQGEFVEELEKLQRQCKIWWEDGTNEVSLKWLMDALGIITILQAHIERLEKTLRERTKDEIHALIEKYGNPQYKTNEFALYDVISITQQLRDRLTSAKGEIEGYKITIATIKTMAESKRARDSMAASNQYLTEIHSLADQAQIQAAPTDTKEEHKNLIRYKDYVESRIGINEVPETYEKWNEAVEELVGDLEQACIEKQLEATGHL